VFFFKYPNLRFDQCPKFSFGVTVDGVFTLGIVYCILTRALQGKTAADKIAGYMYTVVANDAR
jgi:hypothetical protein